jgi:hypothetical protein
LCQNLIFTLFHLSKVTFTSGGDGKLTAELKVKPEHLNKLGGLHGGFSSTLGKVSKLFKIYFWLLNVKKPF